MTQFSDINIDDIEVRVQPETGVVVEDTHGIEAIETSPEAAYKVLTAIQGYVSTLAQVEPKTRETAISSLIKGGSRSGFVAKRGLQSPLRTLQEFMDFIRSLSSKQDVKVIYPPRGVVGEVKHLYVFHVPENYSAFAGEVQEKNLLDYWMRRDQVAGFKPTPENPTGPMTQKVISGMEKQAVRIRVTKRYGDRIKLTEETVTRLFHRGVKMHKSRIVTFLLDKNGNFLGWQPGRWIHDLNPFQQQKWVTLLTNEVVDNDNESH